MFSIGDFARHGRVSVRMLRHYDAIGLLNPSRVDASTGYRWYRAEQLNHLNRIVALKDLGFRLEQIRTMLDEKVSADELRAMLALRRAELETQIQADRARLAEVDARLTIIEMEWGMPTDILVKRIPAVRVAELTATAASFAPDAIGPVIQPLFEELCVRLDRAGVTPTGPSLAYYDDASATDGIVVHAALPVDVEPDSRLDVEIVDLPEIEQAATIVHQGSMDDVLTTAQALAHWIDEHSFRSAGYNRELYLRYGVGDPDTWRTELQEPIVS
ncbi:MerR family transcriptional regulator [Phytoactinopolyspora limicola]|uniref:MerR family transcriptional regulator n=1 Tax=Phytoactinopolyspora limicola TaxID=2715536 RepID=UPI0014083E35|nr:MerR family transcriptional regulator [Phytoactinopolyspora limicola]